MPLYFALGLILLLGFLYLLRWLTRIDPATLARFITYFGVAILLVGGVLLSLAGRGGVSLVAAVLWGSIFWWRQRSQRNSEAAGNSSSRTSTVKSRYLIMSLDQDSGTIDGSVRKGAFAGRRLGDLSLPDLLALLQEIRAKDSDGVALLEAYLDRAKPGWREGQEDRAKAAASSHGAMGREEALAVLGLAPGAGEAEIREAHHRLMLKVHPDHGGSDYLAARLNEARDVLLGG